MLSFSLGKAHSQSLLHKLLSRLFKSIKIVFIKISFSSYFSKFSDKGKAILIKSKEYLFTLIFSSQIPDNKAFRIIFFNSGKKIFFSLKQSKQIICYFWILAKSFKGPNLFEWDNFRIVFQIFELFYCKLPLYLLYLEVMLWLQAEYKSRIFLRSNPKISI